MNLSTNDFASRELSIEELEAIAAGGFFGSIWHGIEHAASAVEHAASSVVHWAESPKGQAELSAAGTVAGWLFKLL